MREVIEGFKCYGHEVKTLIRGGEYNNGKLEIKVSSSPIKKLVKRLVPPILWHSIKDYKLMLFDKKSNKLLQGLVEKFQPDLIYERGFYLMKSGTEVAKKNNIVHFVEINAPYLEEKLDMEGPTFFKEKCEKNEEEVISSAERIVVVSSPLKFYFEKKYPNCATKIIVTPNAVNPTKIKELFNSEEVKGLESKILRGKKAGDIVIGFVGSILPYHGVDSLINVFDELLGEFENLWLLIVGSGETMTELENKTKLLKGVDKIIFTGNITPKHVYNHIGLMDITVLPKIGWYNSPVKIFEYGIMGKAIIAPNTNAVKDVMVDEEDGILINDNVDELKTALGKLIQDRTLREKLGNSFKNKVENYYTWRKVAKKILDAVE